VNVNLSISSAASEGSSAPFLGGYRYRARLKPVLLEILPLVLTLGATIFELLGTWNFLTRIGLAGITSVFSTLGLTALLEQLGRDQGKQKERWLWDHWGGPPTSNLLRYRNSLSNPVIRDRYHKRLSKIVPDIRLPTMEQEKADPAAADQIYEACVRFLINGTRERARFPLVFEENVNYGFRRNLWAMRPAGIVISALAILLSTFLGTRAWSPDDPVCSLVWGIVLLLSTLLFVLWLFRFTSDWVLIAAKAYAERLLETADSL